MAPSAIDIPTIEVKSLQGKNVDHSHLGTKRKIICFSGMCLLMILPILQPRRVHFPCLVQSRWDALTATPLIHFVSDFDGTIFMQDTGHILFNSFGCGSDRREVLDEQIKTGERSFRDVSEEMWGECIHILPVWVFC